MSDETRTTPSCPTCGTPLPVDRSWWASVYRAGIKADLDKLPRTPPEHLTDDQRDVWLAGYDR